MDGSQDFTASRLNFEIAGEGVAVDPATGCLSLPADRLAGITVTVTATDAAGRATSRYRLSVAAVAIEVTVETRDRTGVEMEALTAVAAGLLTIYDMCKAVDRGMRITDVHVLEKHGGKSGSYVAD